MSELEKIKILPLLLAVLLAVALVGADASTYILDSTTDFQVTSEGEDRGEWEVYFVSDELGLVEFQSQDSNQLDFESVDYYDGSWNEIEPESTEPLSFEWNQSEAEYGRIVFELEEPGDYQGQLSFEDSERTVETTHRFEQESNILDLDSLTVPYSVCSFSDNFWICDPEEGEPGYEGELIELDPDEEKSIDVPSDAEVTDFSFLIESVDDQSLQNFTGSQAVFADLGDESAVVTKSADTVTVYSIEGEELWSHQSEYEIDSVDTGTIQHSEDTAEQPDDIVITTENSLEVLDYEGTEVFMRSGDEHGPVLIEELITDRVTDSRDTGDADRSQCVGCGEDALEFDMDFEVNDTQELHYIQLAMNYFEKEDDLNLVIGDSEYDIPVEAIDTSSIDTIKSDSDNIDQMLGLEDNLVLETPDEELNAETDYFKLPLAIAPEAQEELEINIGQEEYSVAPEDVTEELDAENYNTVDNLDALTHLDNSISYTPQEQVSEDSSTYVEVPLNRREGEETDQISLEIGGEQYTLSTSELEATNVERYSDDEGEATSGKRLYGDDELTFNLHYDMPEEFEAEDLYLKTAFSQVGDHAQDIDIDINEETYELDSEQITTSSSTEYSINDGAQNNSTCIGCDGGLRPEFDLTALDIEDSGENTEIGFKACREGEESEELELRGSGLDTRYEFTPEVVECSEGFEWISYTVDGSDIRDDYLALNCEDCDDDNYYNLAADDSTGGEYSRIFNQSESSTITDLGYDYMINASTDTALDFDLAKLPVDKEDIEQDAEVTYSCQDCTDEEHYRLMLDDSTSGNTFYSEEQVEAEGDAITRVWTNTSLDYENVRTRVDSEDLAEETEIDITCNTCDEGYNILSEDSEGETRDGEDLLSTEIGINIIEKPVVYEWVEIPTEGQEYLENDAEISCEGCEDEYYVGLDSGSDLESYRDSEDLPQNFGGSTFRLWTNSSLEHDFIRVPVDEEDIEEEDRGRIECDDCNQPSYNVMVDEDSTLDSWEIQGGEEEELSGGLMARLESFGTNLGNEIVVSRSPSTLEVYNSTGSIVWEETVENTIYDLVTGQVEESETGEEIIVATREDVRVYSSSSEELIRSYPETGEEWVRKVETIDATGDGTEEIVVGTDSGELIAIDEDNEEVWSKDLGSRVRGLTKGEVIRNEEKSLVAGLNDGTVDVISSDGQRILDYEGEEPVVSIDAEDVISREGDEVGVSREDTNVFNMYYSPEDVVFGVNSEQAFELEGVLRGSDQVEDSEITNAINEYLDACEDEVCSVPLAIEASEDGAAQISNLEVDFDYDVSEVIDSQDEVIEWAETEEIEAGEEIRFNALDIFYQTSPAIPLRVTQFRSDGITDHLAGGDFDGNVIFNDLTLSIDAETSTIDLRDSNKSFWLFGDGEERQSDRTWYRSDEAESPVEINSTEFETVDGFDQKNATVFRNTERTEDSFHNVTVGMSLDEEEIRGERFVEVEINGSWKDITPEVEGCEIYNEKEIDEEVFKSCMEDSNGSGTIDRVEVVQPEVGAQESETEYRVGGSSNLPPEITNLSVSPTEEVWGTEHNVVAEFENEEEDNIDAKLWVDSEEGWQKQDESIISGYENQVELEFNTEREMIGSRDLKIEYVDLDENEEPIRPPVNSTDIENPQIETVDVSERPISLDITDSGEQEIDRIGQENSVELAVLDDIDDVTVDSNDAFCFLWADNGATTLVDTTFTSDTGICQLDLENLDDLDVGERNWWIEVDGQDFYMDNQTETQNINLKGNMEFDLEFEDKKAFLENEHDLPEEAEYDISNVLDLTGEDREPESVDITFDGRNYPESPTEEDDYQGELRPEIYQDTPEPGEVEVSFILEKEAFNDAEQEINFTVKDSFESVLSTSEDAIDQSEAVNLTADFERSGEEVNPENVTFDTEADGFCQEIWDDGSTVTCEFAASSSLSSGNYNWSVDAEKDYNEHVQGQDSFDVVGDITAEIDIEDDEVYRNPDSEESNRLSYNIQDIEDEEGASITDADYYLEVQNEDGEFEELDSGNTGNSNSAQEEYTIDSEKEVGGTNFRVIVDTGDNEVTEVKEVDVFGTLEAETTETEDVYIPTTETLTDDDFSTTTDLQIQVEDELENTVADFETEFNRPEGSCSEENGNCEYSPSSNLQAGQYDWNATVEKEFYETAQTENEEVVVKDVLTLELPSGDEGVVESSFEDEVTQTFFLENSRGDRIDATGFEASLEDETAAFTDEQAQLEWGVACEAYNRGEQTLTAQLVEEDPNNLYSIFDDSQELELVVNNTLDVNIGSPLDVEDEDAEAYTQGDNINLETNVTGECGEETEEFDDDIVWSAEMIETEESDTIGSGAESTWSIQDEFSGFTEIQAEVDDDYLEENTDSVEIAIDDVITLNMTETQEEVIREFGEEEWNGSYEASVYTGEEEPANESEIDEDWENFEVTWYLQGEEIDSAETNEDGVVEFEVEYGEEYEPGEVELTVVLEPIDEEELSTAIIAPEQTEDIDVLDESRTTILEAPEEVLFQDEVDLEMEYEIASGEENKDTLDPSFEWRYERPEDSVSIGISSDKQPEWAISSSIYREGLINATTEDDLITSSSDNQTLIGNREANIETWDPQPNIPRDEVTEFSAEVDTPGLSDPSGYEVNFSVFNPDEEDDREVVDVAELDQDGVATINWDASEYDPGQYTTFLEIDDDEELFIEASEQNEEERQISIADDVEVTAYFKDNLEPVPGTRDEDNIHGTRFDNLPTNVVYRDPGPWQHPTEMYFGVNLTAPLANEPGEALVDEADAIFEIEHNETSETHEVQTCEIDAEDPETTSEDFFDFYGCETIWDASEMGSDLEVGAYTLNIRVDPPSEDWTVQEETGLDLEVRGQLQTEIVSHNTEDGNIEQYIMGENNTIDLEAEVTDLTTEETLDAEDLDDVRWRLMDSSSGSSARTITWDDHDSGSQNELETWIDLFDPGDDWRMRSSSQYIGIYVEKEYYEPTRNTHRRNHRNSGLQDRRNAFRQWEGEEARGEVTGAPAFRGYVNENVMDRINYRIPLELELAFPEEITDTDEDDRFEIRVDANRKGTDTSFNSFRGDYELTCLNCSENTDTHVQDAEDESGRSTGEWEFDFSEEEYNEYYEFEIVADSSRDGHITENDDSDDPAAIKQTVRVVRDLGAGEGDCEGDSNNTEPGENVEVCPNEYGFEDLPQSYWLNETATNLEDTIDDMEGPENPEDFDEEEHDFRWKQYQQFANESNEEYYEPDVRWYGEHSEYDELDAGGCNFNGETEGEDEFFESRESCTDWAITAEPPEFESIEVDTGYYRQDNQEPVQEVEAVVDYPTLDYFEFQYENPEGSRTALSPEGEDDSYPHTYIFDVYPEEFEGTFDIELIADTDESERTTETVTIYEDEEEITIDDIEVDDPVNEEEPDTQMDIELDLSGVTIDSDGVEKVGIDSDEDGNYDDAGVNLIFDESDESYTIEDVDFTAEDDTVDVKIFHKSGLESDSENAVFTFNEHDPEVDTFEILEEEDEPFKEGNVINFDIEISDEDEELDYAELTNPDGNQICEEELDDLENGQEVEEISCEYEIETTQTGDDLEFDLEVFDTAGRMGDETLQLEIDNDEPDIENIEIDPEDGIIAPEEEVDIQADISDQLDNIADTSVEDSEGSEVCSAGEFSNEGGDTYECTAIEGSDFEGSTTLEILANDEAGNENNETVEPEILVAANDPEITIKRPDAGALVSGEDVLIEANVTDEDGLLDEDEVEVELDDGTEAFTADMDGSGGSGGEFTYNLDTEELSDGEYSLTVYAEDLAGLDNSETLSEDIEIDNTPPEISIAAINDPITGDYTFEADIEDENDNLDEDALTYEIEDAEGSISQGDLEGSGTEFDTGDVDTTEFSEGDATITIEAEDLAGNDNDETSDPFNINNEPPEVNIIEPTGDSDEFFNEEVTVETNIEDEAGNEDEDSYSAQILDEGIDDNDPEINGDSVEFELDVSSLDTGEYTVEVEADDTENTGPTQETQNINVDTDFPIITSVSIPAENEVVKPETEIEITVQAEVEEDESSDIDLVEASFESGSSTVLSLESGDPDDGVWEGNLEAPDAESVHDIQIEATDLAGNTEEDSDTEVEVDDTPPSVADFGSDAEENEDGEAVTSSDDDVEFAVDATDSNDNLDEVRIEDSDEAVLDIFAENLEGESGGEYTITTSAEDLGLSGGENQLTAVGEDLAGNTGSDNYVVNVQDEDPEIEDFYLDDDVVQSDTNITATAEISSKWLDIVEFSHRGDTIEIDDEEIEQGDDGTQTFEIEIDSDGDHEEEVDVEVYAEDLAGNNNEDTISYEINDENPTIEEELEVEGSDEEISRSDNSLYFALEATDDFEVDRVELHGPSEDSIMDEDGDLYELDITPAQIGCNVDVDFEPCEINADVYDNAENMETSRTVTVNVDDEEPDVSDFTVDQDAVQTDTDVEFSANIDDGDPELETTEVRDSGDTICGLENGNEYSCIESFSEEGEYTLDAYTEDRAGNVNDDEAVELIVTDASPNIGNINDDANTNLDDVGVTRSDEEVRFEATVTDPDDLLVEEEVRIEGQQMESDENQPDVFYLEELPSNLGCVQTDHSECDLEITAEDEAGNQEQREHTIIVDDEPAEIEEVEMEEEVLTSGSTTEVTVRLEENEGEETVNYVEVEPSVSNNNNLTWNGEEWTGNIEIESTEASESSEDLEVRSVDFAQNTDEDTEQSYILDDEDPEVTNFASDAATNDEGEDIAQSDTDLTFDVTIADNVDIDKVEIGKPDDKTVVGEDLGEEETDVEDRSVTESITISSGDLGCTDTDFETCELKATVTDLAGNTGTDTYEVIIDDEPPALEEIELSDNIVQPNTEVEVFLDTDEESDRRIETIETQGDAEETDLEWDEEDGNWSATVELDDTEGQDRELEIFAEDWAGNTNDESKIYTVDDTPPTIEDLRTNSTNDIERSDAILEFSVEAENQFEELESVDVEGMEMERQTEETFAVDAAAEELGCEPVEDELDADTEEATCLINATAIDQAGNDESTGYELVIQNNPPEIVEDSYELDGVIEGDPHDSALPDEDLDLSIESDNPISDTEADLTAIEQETGNIEGGPVSLNDDPSGEDNYNKTFATQDLGITSGLIDFTVNITDEAGNTAEDIYTLDLDTVPPVIEDVYVNNTQPETTRDTVEIKANISHPFNVKEGMEGAYINVTAQNNESFKEQINLENIEDERESPDINSGNFSADFIPPDTDTYDVKVFAEDEFDEPEDELFEEVFTSIGEANLEVSMSPETIEFDNISVDNQDQYQLETVLENTGEASAYDILLQPSNIVTGIESNISDRDCGILEPGEECSVISEINVTADAGAGDRTISSNAFWENPDRTSGSAAEASSVVIDPNPVLDITSESHEEEIIRGETGSLEIELLNRGNMILQGIDASIDSTGGQILGSNDYEFDEVESIEIGESKTQEIQLTDNLEDKGEYPTTFLFETEDPSEECDEDCESTADSNITVFHQASIGVDQEDKTVDREEGKTVDINGEVIDDEDVPVENYSVQYIVDQEEPDIDEAKINETLETSSSGEISEQIDLREDGFAPGEYNVRLEISENSSRFYRTDQEVDEFSLEVRDELNVEQDLVSNSTLWYTDVDDPIIAEYTATDREGEPVEGAEVQFRSNSTQGVEDLEDVDDENINSTCPTNSEGVCDIEYRPDRSSQAFATIESIISKNEYYDFSPVDLQDDIEIEGDFSVVITTPEEEEGLLRGNEYDIQAVVLDSEGNPIEAESLESIDWRINNSDGETIKEPGEDTANETTWDIPSDKSTGEYTIDIRAEDDDNQPPATDEVSINVYEPVTIDNTSVETEVAERKNSEIEFDLTVQDSNDEALENYEICQLFVEGEERDNTTSGSEGECELLWETTQNDEVGPNTAIVEITEFRDDDKWYLPDPEGLTEEEFSIELEEDINLTVSQPSTDVYRVDPVPLQANTTDAFDRFLDTDIEWRLEESDQIIESEELESEFNASDLELGEELLNITAEKGEYNSAFQENDLTLFGRAQHEFEVSDEYFRGDKVDLTTQVKDANTTDTIEDAEVNFYENEEKLGTASTNSTGWANLTWDTEESDIGNNNITAELEDQQDIYYNQTTGNITNEVFLGGEIETEVTDISDKEIYRDEFAEPLQTVFEINTTDDLGDQLENADQEIIVDETTIGNCTTGESGTCSFEWDPSNETRIGELTGKVNTTAEDYFPAQSEEFNLTVQTAARPGLEIEEEIGYNFSESQGASINSTVLESFTGRPIADYDFELGWGQRDQPYEASMNHEDWDSEGEINSTEMGLEINETSLEKEIDLERIDLAEISLNNPENANWSLEIGNEEEIYEIDSNSTSEELELENNTVTELDFETDGKLVLEELVLSTLQLDERRELKYSELWGSETGRESDSGEFTNATVSDSNQLEEEIDDPDETPQGWYYEETDYIDTEIGPGIFGTQGLVVNATEMPGNESATIMRDYSEFSGTSVYEEFTTVEFWMNSELNGTLNMQGSACQENYSFEGLEWSPTQIDINSYHENCGEDVERIEVEFENTLEDELDTEITLDMFNRYRPSDTTEDKKKELKWLPPAAGNYTFKLEIEEEEYYNTTEQIEIVDIEVISTGGGQTPEDDEDEVPEQIGPIESFELEQNTINQTVGAETYGDLTPIGVANDDQQAINISSSTVEGEEFLEAPDDIEIQENGVENIEIGYTSQEPGNYSGTVAVFNSETSERDDIEVNLEVVPVEMELLDIGAEQGTENVTEGDKIYTTAEVAADEEPVTEDIDWNASVEEETCDNTNADSNSTTGIWNITCEAPSVEFNPIETEFELIAEYQELELRDNTELEYRDVTPPFVTSKDAENVEQTQETTIEIEAWDNVEVDRVEGHVEYIENETDMGEIQFQNTEDDWYRAEFDNTSYEGDYDAVVELEDVNGNEKTARVPFSVHPYVDLSGTSTEGTSFEFRRPGTESVLERYELEEEEFNVTAQRRDYDFGIETDVELEELNTFQALNAGDSHRQGVEFYGISLINNTRDPVNVSGGYIGETVPFERPEDTTGYTFSSLSYNTSFEYEESEVTLDYSDTGESPDEIPEEQLNIYWCESSQISECSSTDWLELDTEVNTTTKTAVAESQTSSSYILEREDAGDDDDDGADDDDGQEDGPEDGGEDEDDDTGGAGPLPDDEDDDDGEADGDEGVMELLEGMLGEQLDDFSDEELEELTEELEEEDIEGMSDEELEAILEGMMDELGEDEIEGEDPFMITPRIYHPVMQQGETRTFFMEITNNQAEEIDVDLDVSGDIEEILSFTDDSVEIPAGESMISEMTVAVPDDAEPGSYSGELNAEYEDFNRTSSHQILVTREGMDTVELDVQALTSTVPPGNNLTVGLQIGDAEITTPFDAELDYLVRESETDRIVYNQSESRFVDEGETFQRVMDVRDEETGSYYVQVMMQGSNVTVSDSDTFTIDELFWTPFRRQAALLILLTLLISIVGWKGYAYYWTRKEEGARYVFPVDYSRLPVEDDENYWVGKVAETQKSAFVDPSDLTTHAIVSGSTGSGKSVTASVIVEEALEKDVPVVVFDPTAQWTGFVKELRDDNLLEHYSRFDMNEENDPHPYRGIIQEIKTEDPDLDFDELRSPGEITVFTLNQLTTEEFDQAVRKIIGQIFEKEWEESPDLELLIVFDEVHRLLEEYGGQGGYHALEKGAREFRKWGIGLMMCSQVTADFKQAVSGNIMTEIQMQTKSMEDIERVEKKYGDQFAKRISSSDVGVGMIQNSNYNDGDPWFVDFRPTYHNPHKIPDKELEKYHKLSKELSELKDKLAEKEESGEDVRDKDLELQLAENKLKEGRFKMAKMYIDSLKDEMNMS